jgi:hypothetical protein
LGIGDNSDEIHPQSDPLALHRAAARGLPVSLGDRVRIWLGLDDVPTLQDLETVIAKQEELLVRLNGIAFFQEKHSAAIKDIVIEKDVSAAALGIAQHETLLAAINKLTVALQAAHSFDKPDFSPAQLDWDTVQAIAAHNLEQPIPKEHAATWGG